MFAFYRFLYYNSISINGVEKLLKFVELKKSLAANPPKPCYMVSGDDSFVVKSAVNILLSLTGSFKELNYSSFGKDASVSEIVAALLAPPMLADYRIVTVNDFTGDLKQLKSYLDKPSPTSVLVFVGSITQNFNAIMNRIEVIDCNRLDAVWLSSWVRKKAATEGAEISSDGAKLLVEFCNRDMNRLTNELSKLIVYADGEEITPDTVVSLVSPELEFKVYELSEAIADKNRDKAIELTDLMLADNNSPVSLLSMLFNHFRRLLFVSLNPTSDTLASDLKVKEYAVKIALRQASRFSPKRLKSIFDKLCLFDKDIKAGYISDRNALLTFVCETLTVG